jgi:hypothetical protein
MASNVLPKVSPNVSPMMLRQIMANVNQFPVKVALKNTVLADT